MDDIDDIATGCSQDYNSNQVPDECEFIGTVYLRLELNGQHIPGTITHDVTFVFTDCSTMETQTVPQQVDYSTGLGEVLLSNINIGADWVSVDDCNSLAAIQPLNWHPDDAVVYFTDAQALRQGDLDNDNDIDAATLLNPADNDLAMFVDEQLAGQPVDPPGACGHGDFNGDGRVDLLDYSIFQLSGVGPGPDRCPGTPLRHSRADCNTNGVEDWADIAQGTSYDCDTNGVPDECELCGDLDNDIDVDGDDRSIFLSALGRSVGDPLYNACADANHNGTVDLLDYQAWLMCQDEFQGLEQAFLMDGGSASLALPPEPAGDNLSSVAGSSIVALSVQTEDGESPVAVLQAQTAYELRYISDCATPQLFVLVADSSEGSAAIASARAPSNGPWSSAGNLIETDGDYCDSVGCQIFSNGFAPWACEAGQETGQLLVFTPTGAGSLILTLWLGTFDVESERWIGASSTVTYLVSE